MIEFPTVDDWFQLARRYPAYKKPSNATLKDYGVMRCMRYIDDAFGERGKDCRVLEFGHGFNPAILERFQDKHEVWGADRDQGLPYFGNVDWETRFAKDVAPRCPRVRFVRELLELDNASSELPNGYFDVIASVSVLEEVPMETVENVLAACAAKLRPGGVLIGTHDVRLDEAASRVPAYIAAQRKAGLKIEPLAAMPELDLCYLLVENPLSVMLWYQSGEPEETRKFWGHFGTLFTTATKPKKLFWA